MSPDLRIADADRDAVVAQLRRHAADGRLDAAELEERVAAALAARTQADLGPLLADLPPVPTPGPSRGGRRPGGDQLRAYVAVMALLVAIWALAGAGYFWPVWPALGWGLALLSPAPVCGVKRPHAR